MTEAVSTESAPLWAVNMVSRLSRRVGYLEGTFIGLAMRLHLLASDLRIEGGGIRDELVARVEELAAIAESIPGDDYSK